MELLALTNDDLYVARVLLPDPKAADSMNCEKLAASDCCELGQR
jgi:hypothetical protein